MNSITEIHVTNNFIRIIGIDNNNNNNNNNENNENRLILEYNDSIISRTIYDIKRIMRNAKTINNNNNNNNKLQPLHIYKIPRAIILLYDNKTFRINDNGYDKSMIKVIKISEQYINFILNNIDEITKYNFLDEEKYQQTISIINSKRIIEKKPRLLQQFFTKENDINELINLSKFNIDNNILLNNTIFIEPSCGDGRILVELCNRNYKCIGIDIDYEILQKAQINLKYINDVDNRNNMLGLICQDFLKLSKNDICIPDNSNIIIIGNPPYRDTINEEDHDYTMRFIMKCKEINANRVAFILPKRNSKSKFIEKLINDGWKITIEENILEGKFIFMNEKEISQPSIILILDNTSEKIII
jgi:tRNA G10  N-methylase Trm11